MPDLGLDLFELVLDVPGGPTVDLAPPGPADVLFVPQTGPAGPPGEDGEDGSNGAAGSHLERDYAMASTSWQWDHALGYTPGVLLMLSDRTVIGGAITYNGPDATRAEFHVPVAGIMALS